MHQRLAKLLSYVYKLVS